MSIELGEHLKRGQFGDNGEFAIFPVIDLKAAPPFGVRQKLPTIFFHRDPAIRLRLHQVSHKVQIVLPPALGVLNLPRGQVA